MADIEKLFEVDEHYVITSEVAQVTQSSVSPLQAYAVGSVVGQSLTTPYAFEPSTGGSKVAQPATTTHPHKASNRVARPIIVRAVSLNIPVPTLTFKPYTVNVPLFNFGKDKNYIKKIEDINSRLEDNMFEVQKEAYRKGLEDGEGRFTGVTSDIRRREMVGKRYPEFIGMKAIKAKLGEGRMTWKQLKASSSMLEANKEFAKYYKEMALTERGKQKELKRNLETAAGNFYKLTRIQDVKDTINESLQGRLFNAEKQIANLEKSLASEKSLKFKYIRKLDEVQAFANTASRLLYSTSGISTSDINEMTKLESRAKKAQISQMWEARRQQGVIFPGTRTEIENEIVSQQVEASRQQKLQTTMSRRARRTG